VPQTPLGEGGREWRPPIYISGYATEKWPVQSENRDDVPVSQHSSRPPTWILGVLPLMGGKGKEVKGGE